MKKLAVSLFVWLLLLYTASAVLAQPRSQLTAISVSTSSTRQALTSGGGSQVAILNDGLQTVFVKFGDVTVTAATTDMPIRPGCSIPFDVPPTATYVAAIAASGTSTLRVTQGAQVPQAYCASPSSFSSWLDQAFCQTVGYMIVRLTGSWSCAQAIPVNAEWFGVQAGGDATANVTALNTAIAAVPNGGSMLLPRLGYALNSTITIAKTMAVWCGTSAGETGGIIATTDNDVFHVNAFSVSFNHCAINHAGNPTATGEGIVVGTDAVTVTDAVCPTPAFLTVSGAISGTAGVVRLTVNNVTGVVNSRYVVVTGVGGVSAANGIFKATIFDSTHIELQGTTFSGTYTSGGGVSLAQTITSATNGFSSALPQMAIKLPSCGAFGLTLFDNLLVAEAGQVVIGSSVGASHAAQSILVGFAYTNINIDDVYVDNFHKGIHFKNAAKSRINGMRGQNDIPIHVEDQLNPDFGTTNFSNIYVSCPKNAFTGGADGEYGILLSSGGDVLMDSFKTIGCQDAVHLDYDVGVSGNLLISSGSFELCARSAIYVSSHFNFNDVVVHGQLGCGSIDSAVAYFDNNAASLITNINLNGVVFTSGGGMSVNCGYVSGISVVGAVLNTGGGPQTGVTAAVSGTGGVIRLTVGTTSGIETGRQVSVFNVGGTTEANNYWVATVIDQTHIELQGSTFTHTYTTGGTVASLVPAIKARSNCFNAQFGPNFVQAPKTYESDNDSVSIIDPAGTTYFGLPTSVTNGTMIFISDGKPGNGQCAPGGTGSWAMRQNGMWACPAMVLPNYTATTAWTPGIRGQTTAGTASYNTFNGGSYEIVGSQVTARFNLLTNSFSGASGTAQLTGLPVVASGALSNIDYGVCMFALISGVSLDTGYAVLTGLITPGAQVANLYESGQGVNSQLINISKFQSGLQMVGSCFYHQ